MRPPPDHPRFLRLSAVAALALVTAAASVTSSSAGRGFVPIPNPRQGGPASSFSSLHVDNGGQAVRAHPDPGGAGLYHYHRLQLRRDGLERKLWRPRDGETEEATRRGEAYRQSKEKFHDIP